MYYRSGTLVVTFVLRQINSKTQEIMNNEDWIGQFVIGDLVIQKKSVTLNQSNCGYELLFCCG